MDLQNVINESFTQYAGAVLQSRALVDVRDCLKPSARQIFYCLYTDKFTHDKPFKKTLKAIGSAMRMYIHGDSSCEGIIMRAGQPFAMRYPLMEVEGSYGNLMESGNWAAPRYTSARLSPAGEVLLSSVEKHCIEEWRDNYDDTEQYPVVLPSLGFYNIVNGTMGIGVAMASSIPQFNIQEVNTALVKLLWDRNIPIEKLVCMPDFATGGILLNEDEVRESLIHGTGKAAKLRACIEYNEKDRCLIVTEIPYGVYTNTICGQLEELIEKDPTCGISHFNDLTGKTPLIKIYLNRTAKVNKVLDTLYSKTSLQYYYGINMTMLRDGRFPQVFTWKEALQEHLNHEIKCYRKAFEFELDKCLKRKEVVEGIIRAIDIIDEVIALIKSSNSKTDAANKLVAKLNFTERQADAILAITLSRLAHLEINKYVVELDELKFKIGEYEELLKNQEKLYKVIEDNLIATATRFGDPRRTKIMNLQSTEEDKPVEETMLRLWRTNRNRIYLEESNSMLSHGRGSAPRGMFKDEICIDMKEVSSLDTIYVFTTRGFRYTIEVGKLTPKTWSNITELVPMRGDEAIIAVLTFTDEDLLLLVNSDGTGKLVSGSEFTNKSTAASVVPEGTDLQFVLIKGKSDYGAFVTADGYCMIGNMSGLVTYSRKAKGVKLIGLTAPIVNMAFVDDLSSFDVLTITSNGNCKFTNGTEYRIVNRGGRGIITHKLDPEETIVAAAFVPKTVENLTLITGSGIINIVKNEIATSGRSTKGHKVPKIKDGELVQEVIL